MKEWVIDTNALISFVTDRSPDQQKRIGRLFEDAVKLKIVILCPQNVITEFVYVLEKVYHLPKDQIGAIIADLIALPGLKVVHGVDFEILLSYWPDRIRNYGDAVVATVCKSHKDSRVATFDRKLKSALEAVGIPVAEF
jgi:predicted nucleic acid-binding protein